MVTVIHGLDKCVAHRCYCRMEIGGRGSSSRHFEDESHFVRSKNTETSPVFEYTAGGLGKPSEDARRGPKQRSRRGA